MKKQKKIMVWIFVGVVFINIFSLLSMDNELKKKLNSHVQRQWIPKASLALKLMEESQRANNSVRRIEEELTVGSFNGPTQRVTVKVYDPDNNEKEVTLVYSFDSFKKLLQEPMPINTHDAASLATEEDALVDGPEKNKKKCTCCLFCWE